MTLERRFFMFLLVPVAVLVAAFGFWGFFSQEDIFLISGK